MCSRYSYGISEKDILDVVDYADGLFMPASLPRDIYPTDHALLIVSTDKGITLTEKKWGYPGLDGKGALINARVETVLDKKMYAAGINRHRAVVPASRFYEWNKRKEKSTFTRFNEDIMFMAGFFDHFKDEDGFMILTTAANDSMKPVHDRMPLILEREQIIPWLTDDKVVREILRQIPSELNRSSEYEQMSLF